MSLYIVSFVGFVKDVEALLPVLDDNGLLDLTELLKLGAKSGVVGVPCEATFKVLVLCTS